MLIHIARHNQTAQDSKNSLYYQVGVLPFITLWNKQQTTYIPVGKAVKKLHVQPRKTTFQERRP